MNPHEMEELKAQNKEFGKKLDQILFYLHDDPSTREKGLISEFREHKFFVEEYIHGQKTKEAVRTAKVGLLGTIFGIIGGAIVAAAKTIYTIYVESHYGGSK